jgi:hypothetical protein
MVKRHIDIDYSDIDQIDPPPHARATGKGYRR